MSHVAHQYSRVDFYSSLEVNLSLYYGGVALFSLEFASEVIWKVEPDQCIFLSAYSFMHNNRIVHSNSTGLRTCRDIYPFLTLPLLCNGNSFNHVSSKFNVYINFP